jgi:hypothetical protein
MSSPINLDDNIDPELRYAPPWARKRIAPLAAPPPAAPAVEAGKEIRSLGKADPRFSGDRAFLELQRQLALNPDQVPEPLMEGSSAVRPILIRLCGVLSFAAVVAWGIASYPGGTKKTDDVVPVDVSVAAISSNNASAVELSTQPAIAARQTDEPTLTRNTAASVAVAAPMPAAAPATPSTPVAAVVSTAPVARAPAAAPSAAPSPAAQQDNRSVLRLDADEIEMLVKRGKDFLADGDIASARLLLRRAADAGSAEGALALGSTFDPVVIAQLGAIGTVTDPVQARQWYQRAAELGSPTASQRLAGLDASR